MSPNQNDAPHYVGTVFTKQDIRIDGVEFTECVFGDGCRLVFGGESLPVFRECHVGRQVEIVFTGHAKRTVAFVSMLAHRCDDAGLQLVQDFIHDLLGGAFEDYP